MGTSATLGEKENAPDVLGYAAPFSASPSTQTPSSLRNGCRQGSFLENDMAVSFDLPDPERPMTWTGILRFAP